ncbi:MAG: ATP-binding protein [Bacteroidales bacterium]|nr:ATP-binding protein [Bacteroidales bacterium]
MKYPIGIQNFEKIRKEGFEYIDKTAFVYKLADEGNYYFLSRPRRFGKSLLLSTFEAYFRGERDLFEGLAISELEQHWDRFPIFHLDLNTEKYDTLEALESKLNLALSGWEAKYGSNPNERSLSTRFEGVIGRAFEQEGKRVVILVDEYDKPMLQAIGNEALQEAYRSTLKAFYGALKSCDRCIRFAFLTGVTKFGKVSVFSDLNNLIDISLDRRYVSICGITESELQGQFDGSVEALGEANGMSKEECYAQLKHDYDGYHFDVNTEGIYNPFSILNTLASQQFRDYWFETGTPTFLVRQLQKTNYRLSDMTEERLSADTLNSIDIMEETPLPLLFQSGYLTITGYDPRFRLYRLGFPNREVKEGFIKYLVPFYTPKTDNKSRFSIEQFVSEVEQGRAENFMQRMEAFFAGGDYALMGDKELYFQNAMYVFFTLLGLYVEVERHTTDGRMDMLVQTKDYIYIIELKIDQTADIALQQIDDKGYAKPFATDPRQLFKIGLNFSTERRCIDGWKVEKEVSRFGA